MLNKHWLVLVLVLGVVFATGGLSLAKEDMITVFEDDFSSGADPWIILGDGSADYRVSPGPSNEYLTFGVDSGHVLMRIPDIVTNDFELTIELDMTTNSTDWFGIRFGTTHADPGSWWGPGHIVMVRPNSGAVWFFRQPPGSWKTGDDRQIGSVPRAAGIQTITLRVTPTAMTISIDDHTITFDDTLVVDPGNIDLMGINCGPLKLYNVVLDVAK